MKMVDGLKMIDHIEIWKLKDGRVIDRRVTLGHSASAKLISKFLSMLGVKRYATDLVVDAGKEAVMRTIGAQWWGYSVEIGIGDGTTTTFNGSLTNGFMLIIPGTVIVDVSGRDVLYDQGNGTLYGAEGTGTVNYLTGEISVTFNDPPENGASISASFRGYKLFLWIAVGTGTAAPAKTDTELEAEVAREMVTNISLATVNFTNDTLEYEAEFSFDASYSISECGIFNSDQDGIMLARQTFSPVEVSAGEQLKIFWRITAV